MLDVLEKIALVYTLVVILAVGALYAFVRTPSSVPFEFEAKVQLRQKPAAATAADPGTATLAPGPQDGAASTSGELLIVEKLREQGLRTTVANLEAAKLFGSVTQEQYDHIRTEANVVAELKKLRSRFLDGPRGKTRLVLEKVPANSLLSVFGLQDGDVIELVDGEILDFDNQSTTKYWDIYRQKLADLREGRPVSITISRNRQPAHLVYSFPGR